MFKVYLYSVFTFFMLLFIGISIYFYFMKDPGGRGGPCAYGCESSPLWMNGPECLSVKETKYDPNIPKPSQTPYLSNFKYSAGAGPAFCSPAWYAFRYVKNSDGSYGPLSDWSGTSLEASDGIPLAIYACAKNLPCIPSKSSSGTKSSNSCSAAGIPTGPLTSTFNSPTLALVSPLKFKTNFDSKDGYTLNVHRQVGYIDSDGKIKDFDPKSEGDVVGFFIENPSAKNGIYAKFQDNVFNPESNQSDDCGC